MTANREIIRHTRGLPSMKNTMLPFRSRNGRRRGTKKTIILIVAGLLIVALSAGIYFAVHDASPGQSDGSSPKAVPKSQILDAWAKGDKAQTLELARSSLATRPLDPFYLSFDGIAAYYLSFEKPEGDEKQSLLDDAVFSLRKSLVADNNLPIKAQVEYVLGKAYYQKGSPWYDLAAVYLTKSVEHGYQGSDTEQYLGLVYAGMSDHEKAVQHFESALTKDSSDILMLSAAVSYKELGNVAKADELLSKVIQSASDAVVVQRSRFMLAEMAMNAGDFRKAEGLYQSIIDADPRSAEAWYQLGVVYDAMKDPIRARAAWRKVTAIDPNNIEARKKLAEKL